MATAAMNEILKSFDQLTDSERLEVVSELLKRVAHLNSPPISDEDLVLNAEALFLELDKREAVHEESCS